MESEYSSGEDTTVSSKTHSLMKKIPRLCCCSLFDNLVILFFSFSNFFFLRSYYLHLKHKSLKKIVNLYFGRFCLILIL